MLFFQKKSKLMNSKRRDFLKIAGLTSAAILTEGLMGQSRVKASDLYAPRSNQKRFNMSGYGAPAIDKVRMGFIGLGQRGPTHALGFSHVEGVEVVGLSDIRPEKAEAVKAKLDSQRHRPTVYTGSEDAWKKMCDRNDIDLIVIATPWKLHVPMALYAMKAGKHVAIEVPAARTIKECWDLVLTSETTKKHCMMLENCCYDFFELLTLNMARDGYFGDVIHAEGAYLHYLLDLNFNKKGYYDMWRLKENFRNGNLYPTHGLGPICQVLNENRGDRMIRLSSSSSIDFSMGKRAEELAETDPFFQPFVGKKYRGNMNITNVVTEKGKTLTIYHDVSTERPYSRIHLLTGTQAHCRKYPAPARISKGEDWIDEKGMQALNDQYTPEIIRKVGEMAKKIGGHGGMDFIMQWRLIDCLRNGLPLDEDVYDAASWSVVSPLSEWSVANQCQSIEFPDFTNENWKTNKPVELTLKGGGTTRVV